MNRVNKKKSVTEAGAVNDLCSIGSGSGNQWLHTKSDIDAIVKDLIILFR